MKTKKILLLLDYDGTLARIVRTPDRAKIPSEVKKIIHQLSTKINVGVITGRAMRDIRGRVKIKNIIYAANHGLEIKLPEKKLWVHPAAKKIHLILTGILSKLKQIFKNTPGIYLEDKRYAIGIHYRNTRLSRKDVVRRLKKITEHMFGQKKYPKLKMLFGKKVIEIRPDIPWHKGKAIDKLRKIYRPEATIYIGDDRTDEDAFAALGKKDMGIVIGKKTHTLAKYAISSPAAVKRFLMKLNR